MERILSGIAKINFQQNCEDILVENRTGNLANQTLEIAGAASAMAECCSNNDNTADSSDIESELNSSSETAIVGDDDFDSAGSSNYSGGSLSHRRNLPRRACKENSMKLKRRSIMKPKRHNSRTCDFSMLRPAEIRKIYCNQKLTSFRPTNLETIFEEPQPETRRGEAPIAATDLPLRFIGLRKIRRTLSCSDGLNINKTLIKQRRAKIKKIYGRRSVCKKISLNEFIDRLNKSFGEEADVEDTDDNNTPEEPMEAEMSACSAATMMSVGENITTTKTEYAMPIDISTGSVHDCNDKHDGEHSLFCSSNTFPNLSYSSSTADTTLTAATMTPTCLTGIR